MDGFIRKYVLCPECDNPETELLVSAKKGTISQGCKACGYHGPVEVNHKVNTFILKNPPNLNPASPGSSLTEGKRSKRSKKNGTENGDTSGTITDADATFDDSTVSTESIKKTNVTEVNNFNYKICSFFYTILYSTNTKG